MGGGHRSWQGLYQEKRSRVVVVVAVTAGVATKQLAGGKPAAARPVAIRPAPDAAARAAAAPEYRGIWNSLKKIYFESGWKGPSLPLS
jgi:hypothetical protein